MRPNGNILQRFSHIRNARKGLGERSVNQKKELKYIFISRKTFLAKHKTSQKKNHSWNVPLTKNIRLPERYEIQKLLAVEMHTCILVEYSFFISHVGIVPQGKKGKSRTFCACLWNFLILKAVKRFDNRNIVRVPETG